MASSARRWRPPPRSWMAPTTNAALPNGGFLLPMIGSMPRLHRRAYRQHRVPSLNAVYPVLSRISLSNASSTARHSSSAAATADWIVAVISSSRAMLV